MDHFKKVNVISVKSGEMDSKVDIDKYEFLKKTFFLDILCFYVSVSIKVTKKEKFYINNNLTHKRNFAISINRLYLVGVGEYLKEKRKRITCLFT